MQTSDRRTILAVDDDWYILLALDRQLSRAGYRVVTVANGREALEYAFEQRVDAILLDVQMPGALDGFSLAAALRENPKTARTPIIFVTGVADERFKQRCREAGGEYFICKPYDDNLLIRLLSSIFARDELGEVNRISQAKRRQPVGGRK
ncbi:MAG: response regulator [Planctomycetes bacterium]|nr:response regulator [Planctomycetota bacterium]